MSNPPNQNLYPNDPNRRPNLSIPLQNLPRPPDESGQEGYGERFSQYDGGIGATYHPGSSYEQPPAPPNPPGLTTYWGDQQNLAPPGPGDESHSPGSPIDPMAFSFALPPDIRQTAPTPEPPVIETPAYGAMPAQYEESRYQEQSYQEPSYQEPSYQDLGGGDSDRAPLTTNAQDISGTLSPAGYNSMGRESVFATRNLDTTPQGTMRNSNMLGFDLEPGVAASQTRSHSYGASLTADDRRFSRAPSTALHKTGSIIRAMSQRVVDISGGGQALEAQARRERSRSRSPGADARFSYNVAAPMLQQDTSYSSQAFQGPTEKRSDAEYVMPQPPPMRPRQPMANPLKGKSLGIFSPESRIRNLLCDILVLPWVEPLILLLIVLQAVLLAVDSAPDVWSPGKERRERWGTNTDWVLLGMFILFTLEVIARVIVSGFILNAAEYSTIDRKRGVRAVIGDQYKTFFRPQRQKSIKRPQTQQPYGPSTFARAATLMQGNTLPETLEEQQRMQLARRAFLRHGFNRLDFVAVVSFWISFLLSINGLESKNQLYLFRMLSCLRIIRLLGLTRGNAIILRSLKKAAPLLVRVSFLIGFFWLLFAIVGVQSFKNSFSRSCVYLDPENPLKLEASFTHEMMFCGGHLPRTDLTNMTQEPWVRMERDKDLTSLVPGTKEGKGFICPRGSICLQQGNPFNNTMSFDHILHSMELVFVVMSANTWSDLMYYTVNSDYTQSALFFGAGVMIMMLWMTNLLIAVITSSFQVIREESKASAFTADEDDLNQAHNQDAIKRVSGLQRILNKMNWFWVVLIALDILVQAQRTSQTSDSIKGLMNITQIVVAALLAIEIILRFVANWRFFHQDLRNLADLFLAIANVVILLPPIRNSGQVYEWLTVFQILRIYRVILAVPVTRNLIKLVMGNATGIGNLMLFVFLITFLMAIFASQMFRGLITPQDASGEDIRITFKHIYNSFLGMYQVLSSEGWTSILYTVTAFTTETHVSWIGAIFLIGWFTLAFFILVNMFIAVIQENFDVGEDQKRLEQVKAFLQRKELGGASNPTLTSVFSFGREVKRKDPLDYGPAMMEMLLKEAVVRDFLDEPMDPLQDNADDGQSTHKGVRPSMNAGFWARAWAAIVNKMTSKDPNPFYSNVNFQSSNNETFNPRQMARQAVTASAARKKAQREYLTRHPNYNTSLFIFKPKNFIRRICQRLVGPGRGAERIDGVEPNKYAWYAFSAFIYLSIIAMVVIACITTPLYQRDFLGEGQNTVSLANWFVWTDVAFAIVFTFEALVKVIADGFFWTPNAYFRSLWGLIDLVVLLTLLINVGTILANDGAVSRAVGAFKALRALRLLNISDSARQTFQSFITWKIVSAGFVSMGLLVPFAIYGVNIFNGKLVTCNDGDLDVLVDCFGEYNATPFSDNWPMLAPRAAGNPYFSFDDFGASLFILFQIVSQEGWTDVSFAVQTITGLGNQPKFGAAEGNAMFFVIFNLLATVFVLTLFISVFMRNYTEQTGVAFLTADQRSWLELRKMLRQISPSKSSYGESKSKWKKWCHKRAIEKRGRWYRGITGVLVLHLILLLLEYSTEPDWWSKTRDALFLLFTIIYIGNIAIRITGLGFTRFRRSTWDLFSIVAVSGAFVTSILIFPVKDQDTLIKLHKLFLVAIVLLLIPRNDALDQLFKTAAASITTIGNLLATWLVFFLVFAIALTQAFSLTRFGANEDHIINFRNVPNAMILLFRISVGEGWNELMSDFADIEPPFCVESPDFFSSDCGSMAWARTLFIAWNILSMYIFVNLFVSLIYESFSYVYQRSSGLAELDRDEIRRFKEAWRSVDPNGTGYISKEAFPRLLSELSGVFEMRVYDSENSVGTILEDIRTDQGGLGGMTGGIGAMSHSHVPHQQRHASVSSTTPAGTYGVDLAKLNERLSQIDVHRVRERRRRFNLFFEEVMVSADVDKGISFTTVLMILAHYNIINDSKSLRLEEFLKRRARLQRVEEELRRRVVLGFFVTLYWSRKFRRHMDLKRSARMTAVPQLDVPDILVDDEEDPQQRQSYQERLAAETASFADAPPGPSATSNTASIFSYRGPSMYLSAEDAARSPGAAGSGSGHHRSWSGTSVDIASHAMSYGHPLSMPRAPASPTSPGFGPVTAPPQFQQQGQQQGQHAHNNSQNSAFSFELSDPSAGGYGSWNSTNSYYSTMGDPYQMHPSTQQGQPGEAGASGMLQPPGSNASSRRGSSVSPAQARDLLDDSVWVESIRRSATQRRSGWGGGGGGYYGQ